MTIRGSDSILPGTMSSPVSTTAPALQITGLRKSYGPVVAVDCLDLTVHAGECFGILGPNGAGKTTTIEICEGLTAADAGEVSVLGLTWRSDARRLRERLGISLQETRLSDKLTVRETLDLFRSFYPDSRPVDEVLRTVELTEKTLSRVGNLSGGQRQRLALACALVGNPDLFFLDEPTTGLDPQSRLQVWDLVAGFRKEGRTVVLTTHYMEEAQHLCDRVAIVDHGRVIALGTPRELVASMGAEHVVEFTLDPDPGAETLVTLLADAPGLHGVRPVQGGGAFTARAEPVQTALPSLLERCARHGLTVTGLQVHTATLEDLFVSLTGRHLRDG